MMSEPHSKLQNETLICVQMAFVAEHRILLTSSENTTYVTQKVSQPQIVVGSKCGKKYTWKLIK